MSKRILINAVHAEEVRIVLVENDSVIDLCYEINSNEHIKGNIYKGRVVRVEPGLQAAFIEYSDRRHGFLPFKDISPDYYSQDYNKSKNKRKIRIQDVIKKNQEVLVQVEREERDSKGASLTTYLSIAGRYIVMIPGEKKRIGISKKIEDSQLRERIKDIFEALKPPDDMAFILRTAGIDKKKSDFSSDLKYLMNQWTQIKEQSEKLAVPALAYKELDVSMKYIRDYLGPDIDEVLVDDRETYRNIRDFLKKISPAQQRLIKLYREKKPIFLHFNIEKQIENIHKRRIALTSGGHIVIDRTEALTSIDINSGKSTSEEDIETTAFKTNIEAAVEIARQLRLRDIGGLIVIDFIDMSVKKHRQKLERKMKEVVKLDKAHTEFAHISHFGLLEMSRERLRQTMSDATNSICLHCGGIGKIKSPEAHAMAALRKIQYEVYVNNAQEVTCTLPVKCTNYLLNEKRADIITLEKNMGVPLILQGSEQALSEDFDIKVLKKEITETEEPDTTGTAKTIQKSTSKTKRRRTRKRRPPSTQTQVREDSGKVVKNELSQPEQSPEAAALEKEKDRKTFVSEVSESEKSPESPKETGEIHTQETDKDNQTVIPEVSEHEKSPESPKDIGEIHAQETDKDNQTVIPEVAEHEKSQESSKETGAIHAQETELPQDMVKSEEVLH